MFLTLRGSLFCGMSNVNYGLRRKIDRLTNTQDVVCNFNVFTEPLKSVHGS